MALDDKGSRGKHIKQTILLNHKRSVTDREPYSRHNPFSICLLLVLANIKINIPLLWL